MPGDDTGFGGSRKIWFDLSLRQLTVVAFGGISLVTVVAAAAYMAGRLSEIDNRASKLAAGPAAAASEQIIVVDPPAGTPAKSVLAAVPAVPKPLRVDPVPQPHVASPVPAQASATVAPAPTPGPAPTPVIAPTPVPAPASSGQMFFQVAALDKAMADVSADYLTRKGFPACVADGPTPAVFRVLVGPLGNERQSNEVKASLEGLGFRPFLKRL
jgi:hypothetical protein